MDVFNKDLIISILSTSVLARGSIGFLSGVLVAGVVSLLFPDKASLGRRQLMLIIITLAFGVVIRVMMYFCQLQDNHIIFFSSYNMGMICVATSMPTSYPWRRLQAIAFFKMLVFVTIAIILCELMFEAY